MAKATSEQMLKCVVTLSVKQALALRDLGVAIEFRCPNPECNQRVHPVAKGKAKVGTKYKAHFEHDNRNPRCRFGVGIKTMVPTTQPDGSPFPQ